MTSEWEFLVRVALAAILGGTLGFIADLRRAAAGIRTFALVGLGSAAFISAAILTSEAAGTGSTTLVDNQVRMAAGLVAGVGFLGAGAILRTDERVHGLITAAGIWVTAAIGLLVGSGFVILGIGVTILALIAIIGLRPLHEELREPGDTTDGHGGSGLG
jgi:putative Mg2+ transporter-C (MgtC) family protein